MFKLRRWRGGLEGESQPKGRKVRGKKPSEAGSWGRSVPREEAGFSPHWMLPYN